MSMVETRLQHSQNLPRYSEFMKDPERMGLVEVPKALLDSKSKYTQWHDEKSSSGKKAGAARMKCKTV